MPYTTAPIIGTFNNGRQAKGLIQRTQGKKVIAHQSHGERLGASQEQRFTSLKHCPTVRQRRGQFMSAEFWAFIGMGLCLALLLYQFIGGLRGEMRGLRGEVGALL